MKCLPKISVGIPVDFKMASVKEFWLTVHKNKMDGDSKTYFYDSCIFQQQWNEICKAFRSQSVGWCHNFRKQHVEYLTQFLLDSLLEHDFITATRCIMGMSGNIRQLAELVWRAGFETLQSLKRNNVCIVQFFKYVFMLCYPYQGEILLDFAMYLIQEKQEITEAYELIRGKCGNKPFNQNKLLQAYLGLLEYVTWSTKEIKRKQSSLEQDFETNIDTQTSKQIGFHGNKAMGYFGNLVEIDGLWDIFVTRQVELLVYYGKVDEARKILERYREKNPENPNAYRYLYQFLKKQEVPKSELQGVLEKLFAVDPTSELVKEYTKLVKKEDGQLQSDPKSICQELCLLFNKLDHYSCRNSFNEWKALAKILDTSYYENAINEDVDQTIRDCWEERADWWPQYHFQEKQLLKISSFTECDWEIVLEKGRVAQWLLGKDNGYVKAVKKLQEENLKKTDKRSTIDSQQNDSSYETGERCLRNYKRKVKHPGNMEKKIKVEK